MGLGQILGPLWAASFLNDLVIMGGVNLVMVLLITVGLLKEYLLFYKIAGAL